MALEYNHFNSDMKKIENKRAYTKFYVPKEQQRIQNFLQIKIK